jgi:hypothetical protein
MGMVPLGRHRRGWEDIIKMDYGWIFLAQDWDRKVINFEFCKCGELLTG